MYYVIIFPLCNVEHSISWIRTYKQGYDYIILHKVKVEKILNMLIPRSCQSKQNSSSYDFFEKKCSAITWPVHLWCIADASHITWWVLLGLTWFWYQHVQNSFYFHLMQDYIIIPLFICSNLGNTMFYIAQEEYTYIIHIQY
jgi:hypothetical protein